jgi:hypothetical protein
MIPSKGAHGWERLVVIKERYEGTIQKIKAGNKY